jgi:hypothetical protein
MAVAVTLVLTASVATSAWADRPSVAQPEAAIAASHDAARPTIRPNPDEQTVTIPAAAATLTGSPPSCGDVCSGHGYGFVSAGPTTVAVSSDGGFHWRDAGLGAVACIVLLGIGLAGTVTVTKGRKRRLAEQRTIATH